MPLFFVSDVPLVCINQAAKQYHVPAQLIIAVLNVERGRIGVVSKNKNGTSDLGPMQINTSWWPRLYEYHITPSEVAYNPCINVSVGAWILAQSIAEGKSLLNGVGDYHSHTLIYNNWYQQKVSENYTMLAKYLNKNINKNT